MTARTLVPTIDLSGERESIAAQIDESAREVGFFQVVGHGIDQAVIDNAWETARRFFELDVADKLAVQIQPGEAYGYGPLQSEALAASLGDTTPPDLKETFSAGPFDAPPLSLADDSAAFVFSPNRWPSAIPEMSETFGAYYEAMGGLAAQLLRLMAVALDLPDSYFEPMIDQHPSAIRALRYPDLGDSAPLQGQLRAGAHTDYGTLTLLRQDDAPGGLEVRGVDGDWHAIPAVAGAFVVNVGDALERWSNDRWRSTLHRVVVPPTDTGRDCSRQSMAFFHNANWDATIECLPTCTDEDNPPRYAPIEASRHLMEKFQSTQPD